MAQFSDRTCKISGRKACFREQSLLLYSTLPIKSPSTNSLVAMFLNPTIKLGAQRNGARRNLTQRGKVRERPVGPPGASIDRIKRHRAKSARVGAVRAIIPHHPDISGGNQTGILDL